MLRQPSKRKLADVDVQKLEKDIRGRLEAELMKKITEHPASSSHEKKKMFSLHIIKT